MSLPRRHDIENSKNDVLDIFRSKCNLEEDKKFLTLLLHREWEQNYTTTELDNNESINEFFKIHIPTMMNWTVEKTKDSEIDEQRETRSFRKKKSSFCVVKSTDIKSMEGIISMNGRQIKQLFENGLLQALQLADELGRVWDFDNAENRER